MVKKLVYIASLGHSGSTLLDLVLGSHSKYIGLGEIAQVLKDSKDDFLKTRKVRCSCGEFMNDCEFWSPVTTRIAASSNKDMTRLYEIVLDSFYEKYGANCIPVDSSKYIKPLSVLNTIRDVQLKIVNIKKGKSSLF